MHWAPPRCNDFLYYKHLHFLPCTTIDLELTRGSPRLPRLLVGVDIDNDSGARRMSERDRHSFRNRRVVSDRWGKLPRRYRPEIDPSFARLRRNGLLDATFGLATPATR
jgi:hypothetical protein